MHTPIKFYVNLPADLFRAGTPTKPKFDYLRTSPPRDDTQIYDVKINPETNMINHKSGGLSLFKLPDYAFSNDWWVVPEGTRLPPEFTLSKDSTDGNFRGHYTIRALTDIDIEVWKTTLKKWAEKNAINIKDYKSEQEQ